MSDMLPIAPGPQRVDPHALAERRRRRGPRRLAVWGAFLLFGLLLGTIYATGFAETTGKNGTLATPANVNGSPATNENSAELKEELTTVTPELSYNWAGRWGSITTAVMYQADLSLFTSDEKFFSEVVLTNPPTDFSDLQLQLRIAKIEGTKTCSADGVIALESTTAGGGALAENKNKRVMVFDAADAQVTFSGIDGAVGGLLGGSKYCIGIVNYTGPPAAGKDTGGTFIRKSTAGSGFSGTRPSFVATLNRMS